MKKKNVTDGSGGRFKSSILCNVMNGKYFRNPKLYLSGDAEPTEIERQNF